jgi:hypothetical protein
MIRQGIAQLLNGDFEQGESYWSFINQNLPAGLVTSNPTGDGDIPLGVNSALLGKTNYACGASGVPIGYAAVDRTRASRSECAALF